jgi:hypothetical protein
MREKPFSPPGENQKSAPKADFWFNSPPLAYLPSSRSLPNRYPSQRSPHTLRNWTPIPKRHDEGV